MTNYIGNSYQKTVIEGSVEFPNILLANSRGITYSVPLSITSTTGSSAYFTSITGSNVISSPSITGSSGFFSSLTGSSIYASNINVATSMTAPNLFVTSAITIPVAASGSASLGSLFFNSTDRKLYIYDGSGTGYISTSALS